MTWFSYLSAKRGQVVLLGKKNLHLKFLTCVYILKYKNFFAGVVMFD
jgi:hypothetical protein